MAFHYYALSFLKEISTNPVSKSKAATTTNNNYNSNNTFSELGN